jgi:osmotically-inducible protein OsmY
MPHSKPPAEEEEPRLELSVLSAHRHVVPPNSHDVILQSRIWDQIRAAHEIDATGLSVVVRNRSATLFGTIADQGQRAKLESIALGISGVLEVINRLRVSAPTH